MNRTETARIRAFLLVLGALATAGCGGGEAPLDFAGENLVVITIDTLRADRLGFSGHARAETPNLDRMARQGVLFANAYCSVPLTLPSHTTLFTGRYPFATGVRLNGVHHVSESEVTLAELFQARGFSTSATVSSYVLTAKFGLDQGFDVYEDSLEMGDLFRFFSEITGDEVYRRFSASLPRDPARNFFGWAHFYDVHAPYEPPPPFLERFSDSPYDGEIAFVDYQIGRILDDLESAGLLETTLVVVTSEHGEAFFEHLEEGHGMLTYEPTMRVPLLFFAPGRLAEGRVVEDRVSLVDLMPTLVDLYGLDRPQGLQGRSLIGLLRGRPAEPRSIYFESLAGELEKNWAPRTGVIVDDHKYISVPVAELYDLGQDPEEATNILPRQARLAKRLDEELQRMLLQAEPTTDDTRRELTDEDIRQLQALGYLSTSSSRASELLDPKRGIRIEMDARLIQNRINEGRLEEAKQTLDALVASNPGLQVSDFHHLRHQILAAQGDRAGALAALEEGVAQIPDSAMAFKLAAYHLELGDLDEAERQALALLEDHPRLSQAMNLLGMVAEQRGDPAEALRRFQQAQELEPGSIPLQVKIADALARMGEIPRALEIYDELLSRGALEGEADKIYKAAALHSVVGNLQRAVELFRKGLAIAPAGTHYLGLAVVLSRTGERAEAIRNLEIALGDHRDDLAAPQLQLAEAALRTLRATP